MPDVVDQIYEAAFVPDAWENVLSRVAQISGSASGSLLVFPGPGIAPRFRATPLTQAELHQHVTTDAWRRSRSAEVTFANSRHPSFNGFSYMRDFMSAEDIAADSVIASLGRLGLHAQIGTLIPMMGGELVVYTFERWHQDGRHSEAEVATLDSLRSHLARAGLIAARLGLEKARGTVQGMEALGLPAAVLRGRRVLAANSLFEREPTTLRIGSGDGFSLASGAADALISAAISQQVGVPEVLSVPLSATEDRPARVVHVLPLRRSAHEIFAGDTLIAVTVVGAGEATPQPGVLSALFDLSPAEARLATLVAAGMSLKAAAAANGIKISTARSYIEQIFRKTGTKQQSQLVALLTSTQPLRRH